MLPPPRYRPSRSLPARAYVPGRSPHRARPPDAGAGAAANAPPGHLPAERWADNAEYLYGVDLYNAGYFWEAHEAWEGLWRAAAGRDPVQRALLQGLIQCAAACLKAVLGDAAACRRLGNRGLARLQQAHADHPGAIMGLDLARFIADFRSFADSDPIAVADRPPLRLALPDSGLQP